MKAKPLILVGAALAAALVARRKRGSGDVWEQATRPAPTTPQRDLR